MGSVSVCKKFIVADSKVVVRCERGGRRGVPVRVKVAVAVAVGVAVAGHQQVRARAEDRPTADDDKHVTSVSIRGQGH